MRIRCASAHLEAVSGAHAHAQVRNVWKSLRTHFQDEDKARRSPLAALAETSRPEATFPTAKCTFVSIVGSVKLVGNNVIIDTKV